MPAPSLTPLCRSLRRTLASLSLGLLACLLGLAFAEPSLRGQASAPDIEARIGAIYPLSPATVKLFGQDVPTGTTVQANLDFDPADPLGGQVFDPVVDRSLCPRFLAWRGRDTTFVSRVPFLGTNASRTAILVSAQASIGRWPGSAGSVRVLDSRWVIDRIVFSGERGLPSLPGNPGTFTTLPSTRGMVIDRLGGEVRWNIRGSCPSCGCDENGIHFLILLKTRTPQTAVLDFRFDGSLWPGKDLLQADATLELGSDAALLGDYVVDLLVRSGPNDTPRVALSVPFPGLVPNQSLSFPNLPLLDTSSDAIYTTYSVEWSLRRTDLPMTIDTGRYALMRQPGPVVMDP